MQSEWKRVTIGEITDRCLGKMLDQKKNRGDLHPYLGNSNVRWGTFELESLAEMRFENHEHERYGVKHGDLIVCEGGEPGRCAIWKEYRPNMKIQKALHRVRAKNGLDIRYLHYWLLQAGKIGTLDQYFTGTTIKHLTGKALAQVELMLPPLIEQKRIASILSSLDDKIELNRKMNETLEAMAHAMFKSWFVDFDPVIDNALAAGNTIPEELAERAEQRKALGDKRKKLPPEIKKLFPNEFIFTNELGWIPKGWGVEPLNNVVEYIVDNRGKTPPLTLDKDNAYPLVEVNALKGNNRFFDKTVIRKYVSQETYNNWFRKGHPSNGDVLLSTVGSIAEVCLIGDDKCCIAQNIISLRCKEKSYGLFLYELLKHNKNELINLNISSVQPSIKVPHLMNMDVLVGHNLYGLFEKITNIYSKKYKTNQNQNIELSRLRDTLLPKLLSGELRIKDAEKLVEEII